MAFQPPFNQSQWNDASKMYKLMRSNLRQLRRTHAPRTPVEKRLLDLYRVAIQRFGEQLLARPAKIDATVINRLGIKAVDAFTSYMYAFSDAD